MKKINAFALLTLVVFASLFTACKKKEAKQDPLNNPVANQVGGSPTIPSDAAGALYAINYVVVDNSSGYPDTSRYNYDYAWFNSYTSTDNAGAVTCNGDSLFTRSGFSNYSYPWYTCIMVFANDMSTAAVNWIVQGGSGVPTINYSDNTPWPRVNNFTVPTDINIASGYTVNFNIIGSNDAVFATISGSKGHKTIQLNANSTSATFTSQQLGSVAYTGGDAIAITIMPVVISNTSFSGKKYYFVKQNSVSLSTFTQ